MDQTMLARSSSVSVVSADRGSLARKWPFSVSAMTSAPPSVLWKEAAGAAAGSLSVTGVVVSPAAASWSVTDSITVSGSAASSAQTVGIVGSSRLRLRISARTPEST